MALGHGYLLAMSRTVNVAELKDGLSQYLRLVQQGETILIRSRDRIVARLEAAHGPSRDEDDDEAWKSRLEAKGIIRRGKGPITTKLLGEPLNVDADLGGAVREEREEGW